MSSSLKLFFAFRVGNSLYGLGEVALFSDLQNEGVRYQFVSAPVPGPGWFPRSHSKVSSKGPGFLTPGTVDSGGQRSLCRGGCPMPLWVLSSSPAFYPLEASHHRSDHQNNASRHERMPSGHKTVPCGEPLHWTMRPGSSHLQGACVCGARLQEGALDFFLSKLFSLKTQQKKTRLYITLNI